MTKQETDLWIRVYAATIVDCHSHFSVAQDARDSAAGEARAAVEMLRQEAPGATMFEVEMKNLDHYTWKKLASFMADRNGDRCPMTGYPTQPSSSGLAYRRRSDGQVFLITKVDVKDQQAAELLKADRQKLDHWAK